MWKKIDVDTGQTSLTFKIEVNDNFISYRRFLTLLSEDDEFVRWYNQVLIDCPFDAFFWENKPVTKHNMDDTYECTLVESEQLSRVSPDTTTFDSHFESDSDVVQFLNLGGDARLIVPCPVADNSVYTQIGSFVRRAPEHQIQNFWKLVGYEMLNQVQFDSRWLSTSGLGVYWLHVRIDSVPKYYQTESYKKPH